MIEWLGLLAEKKFDVEEDLIVYEFMKKVGNRVLETVRNTGA